MSPGSSMQSPAGAAAVSGDGSMSTSFATTSSLHTLGMLGGSPSGGSVPSSPASPEPRIAKRSPARGVNPPIDVAVLNDWLAPFVALKTSHSPAQPSSSATTSVLLPSQLVCGGSSHVGPPLDDEDSLLALVV